ncbi:hypothetical protein GDO86_002616 [Hymenochirus boettgeri]|uniref:Cystatin domain-containing protein n=1 Tax=Hymenochirus boettgeri TaxID=247094 RepID=A0A8T2K0D1_9PIPI|nr:hypothetical protein GDO86_002616 [Hymenochirus boettgeri]
MPLCGGLGAKKPVDDSVRDICGKMKAEFFQRSGMNTDTFEPVEYKTQLVAGVNYFIKVHVGDEEYAHLRVYKTLPHAGETLSLTAFQINKKRDDDIVHFEP